jgi:hypothetical protein
MEGVLRRCCVWDFWPREGATLSRSDRLPLLAKRVIVDALRVIGDQVAWWHDVKDGLVWPITTSFLSAA